jgi:signal transduction histidine kinase
MINSPIANARPGAELEPAFEFHHGTPFLESRLRESVLPFVALSRGALSGACARFLTDDLIHQLVRTELHIRMEERVNERTRIARDLHDTLLQSFQGVVLKLSAVQYVIRDRPADAAGMVERIVEQARQAVTEGRDAILGLRSSVVTNDLAKAITTFGEGLASDQPGGKSPYFRVDAEGTSMDLAPLIRDEVYRIVGEALRNAFRHADARRIEVKIYYDKRRLRIRVQDDGRGIDPQFLSDGGRTGHHGLPGMYERAQLAGGKLIVWSELDSGTQIELSIPASVACAKAPVPRGSTDTVPQLE